MAQPGNLRPARRLWRTVEHSAERTSLGARVPALRMALRTTEAAVAGNSEPAPSQT